VSEYWFFDVIHSIFECKLRIEAENHLKDKKRQAASTKNLVVL